MKRRDQLERDLVKCEDMRLHAERAVRFLGGRSLDEFLDDELVQAAVIRCVEVIGMRNVLAHDYGVVMPEKVHEVVIEQVPELVERLGPLIATLEAEVGWEDKKDEGDES